MARERSLGKCPLCESEAELERHTQEGQWLVLCPACRRFTIDQDLLTVLRDPATRQHPLVRDLLPFLSVAAVTTWAEGRRLNISLENWRAVAHDVAIGAVRH